MSTSSDGAPVREEPPAPPVAGAAPLRRTMRAAARAGARRAAVVPGGRRSSRNPAASEHGGWRRYGPAVLSIALALFAVPLSFFVWYALISLGAYPGNKAVSDLIVGVLYTAFVHAILLAGILLAISSIQARRREGRPPIAGWIGVVLNAVVLIYWELLVSPWLVVLWNRAIGS